MTTPENPFYDYHPHASLSKETIAALMRWAIDGIQPGHAITAVLENDLFAFYSRADTIRMKEISTIIMLLYNEFPPDCYGSISKVRKWRSAAREFNKTRQPLIDKIFRAVNRDRMATGKSVFITIDKYHSTKFTQEQEWNSL
jgi:hypothetical protein